MALEQIGGHVAEVFRGVTSFDERHTFGEKPFELDRADLGAVLFPRLRV